MVEVAVGIFLLTGVQLQLIAGIAAGLIALFTLSSLLKKRTPGDCGCMGTLLRANTRTKMLSRNLGLFVVSLLLLVTDGMIEDLAVISGHRAIYVSAASAVAAYWLAFAKRHRAPKTAAELML